nr:RNA-directed DNA polymerase, eukaryota [Tanacetum cinerariifolium]
MFHKRTKHIDVQYHWIRDAIEDVSSREDLVYLSYLIVDLSGTRCPVEDIKQKSRVRWVVEGDENTRFFHSILRYNYAAFNLKGVLVDGIWCDSPNDIKDVAVDHYAKRFKEHLTEVEAVASSIGCTHESIPFVYIGLPVEKKMNFCDGWSVVIDRLRDRLFAWKAKALSIGRALRLFSQRLVNGSWVGNWDWRAPPRGRSLDDLSSILFRIGGVYLDGNEDDKWTWDRDISGSFKVRTLTCRLQDLLLANHSIGPHHM